MSLGTKLFTYFRGELVGEDSDGNKYYREKNGPRRWVMYNGEVEATRVPPEWHRWLHRTTDKTPVEEPPVVKDWEKDHIPNLTGTVNAYLPDGHVSNPADRKKTTGDYEAWSPE